MKFTGYVIMFFCLLAAAGRIQAQEEFLGPLPGWANIKTRFGAKGDGVHDDTKAIQQALDSLTQPLVNYNTGKGAYMVVYLPAGTYCISATLNLSGKIGVSFIGESPASTVFKWKGSDSATMLLANGSAYIKISRIAWDANGRKGVEALGIHWKTKWSDERSQSSAPVNIEVSDNLFVGNCRYGISGGTVPGEGIGQMDSEISIRRCVFKGCTDAGIHIRGYNALDYWIWDCRFLECKDGINSNYGNYHVYRSYFMGSKLADVHNTNGYYTSVRGCYSDRSYIFSHDEGFSSNPFKRIFQSNTVIAPSNIPIELYHLGKITMLDNQFDAATRPAVQTFVQTGSWAKGNYEVLSFDNTYKDKDPIKITSSPNKIYSSGDVYGVAPKRNDAVAFTSSQDKMPPMSGRVIITVPAGAGAQKIQELIYKAAALKGKRPVLYFPFGKYSLDQPLKIPAGADMQITGDGYLYASVLLPSAVFPKGMALLEVDGPTKIVIRDIQLNNFTSATGVIDGIQFRNVDQDNSQAYVEQLYTNALHSINGDHLDNLYIQETNSFYSLGNSISGGLQVQKGKGSSCLYSFGGQTGGAGVSDNARLVAKDCWWEGPARKPLDFSGKGSITIDGAMLAPVGADSNTTVSVGRFSGNISLLNMYIEGGFEAVPANPNLNLLLWNIHFCFTLDPLKFVTPAVRYKGAFMGLSTQCFTQGDPKCNDIHTLDDVFTKGVDQSSYLPAMLADDRAAMPKVYTAAAPGTSNIFISRVSIGDCMTAVRFSK